MSVIGSNILAGASGQGGGYNLTRSLRFRSSASSSLSRTPASTGNQRTFTYSIWVKRGALGPNSTLLGTRDGSSNQVVIQFNSDAFRVFSETGAGANDLVTTQIFRDPSAWYHLVVASDTTQSTASNRTKVYVNGVQVTAFSSSGYPAQNTDLPIFLSGQTARIGARSSNDQFLDGYLTEVNFIDGQALTPSSFGQTSTTTGVWQPKKYVGTYGTNGFYLPFTNNSTTTTLGNDFSGNGNNWTTNNISLTAGATYDSMTDVPTLTSATASNYCVLNPIFDPNYLASTNQSNVTMSGGNLNYGTGGRNGFGTIAPSSGKYYWEMSNTSNTSASVVVTGVVTIDARSSIYGVYYNSTNGNKGQGFLASGASETAYGATWTDNDIIGVALDCDTNTVTFYKNNVSQGAITNSNLAGKQIVAWMQSGNNVNSMTGWFNFGQRPFAYTPPTGFVALNTFNLPTPTIGATASTQAGKYFNPVLYSGNSSTQTITGVGFQADFTWIKHRNGTSWHFLTDVIRGGTNVLASNETSAEFVRSNNIQSWNSDGFVLGADGSTNLSGGTYVAWNWKANGTGVTNTAGSITSTVSANTSSGFSVVTYNGTNSQSTVGHGLGAVPKMIIVKARSGGTENWAVYHNSIGAGNKLFLNLTSASTATGNWQSTTPTSTVFYVDGASTSVNASGWTYVAYCFSEVAGFSKFGSYTGNGSTDAPFVYLGFRPKFILFKNASNGSQYWEIYDTSRDTYNAAGLRLFPNASDAENDVRPEFDLLSNGFKVRDNQISNNGNGNTIIYAAFAESPFKYSLGR